MSTNELKEFFTRQGKMYHSKVNAICCLEAALQEQVKIKCDGQIPHKHIPQLLHTNETGENQKFLTQYKHLFLSYLDQVIHNNQKHLSELTVELEQILMSTDKEAATFKTPNRPLSFHYNKFLRENDIEDHVPLPELQLRLGSRGASPRVSKRNRRRKRPDNSQPAAVKLPRMAENSINEQGNSSPHFLSQGLKPPPKPD